ncbi:MAG: hypothetical protein ABSG28_08385 [Methanoregula sp.]|jgi:hypothetical protein|uniref:hypothetical protein n=1 Tax=Methanoregula sp. TaxID=2052170 RepID=UPI003C216B83
MEKPIYLTVLVVSTILMLLVAGCITPPKGTTASSASSPSGGSSATGTSSSATTAPPAYVTVATPFTTGNPNVQTNAPGNNPGATPTPVPADLSCLIYLNTQFYSYNTTAVTFDLKNPPMYINYTVIPFNITVNKYVESNQGGHNMITLQYSDYAPYSWFEITVRNKTTGEIYLQDGFGRAQGLGIYTSATLGPILKTDDLLVEMEGQNITATTGIWVKPTGNFDDPQNQTFPECKYWNVHPQNYLVLPSTTATPTWTPVNVQAQ